MTRESAKERIETELNKLNWSIEIIRSILDTLDNEYKAPPNANLIECAAEACGTTPEEMITKSRKRQNVIARQLVMHELVSQGKTYERAGNAFGLDHTTVIHTLKKMSAMDFDPELKKCFQKFQLLINS